MNRQHNDLNTDITWASADASSVSAWSAACEPSSAIAATVLKQRDSSGNSGEVKVHAPSDANSGGTALHSSSTHEVRSLLPGPGLTTFAIKMIGVVLMVVDHIHQMFTPFGAPAWLDWFGRPVATLFFFVSVIGFSHTHSKKTYIWRLYACMVAMSLLMDGLQRVVAVGNVQLTNNIFRDLCIGAVFMAAIDQFAVSSQGERAKHIALGILLFALPFVLSAVPLALSGVVVSGALPGWVLAVVSAFTPGILLAENTLMVLLIPVMYIFRNNRWIQCAAIAACAAVYAIMHMTQWIMVFAIIPILLYNGKKGRGDKYFFYIFYPAHIVVLYLIAAVI